MSLNKEEFELIYNSYYRLVRSIIFRSVGEKELDELTQVTFMKVYEKHSGLKDTKKIKSWVCAIAVNVVRDYIRKKKRRSWLSFFGKDEIDLADDSQNVSARVEFNEVVDFISTKLSPILKEVVILYSFEELKITEISEVLKIPVGTVKSRIFDARKALREHIK